MRFLKIVILSILIFAGLSSAYIATPKKYKYAISDWYARIGAQPFIESPDSFYAKDQSEVIRGLEARNLKPTCVGNLLPEEKIGKLYDYQCYSFISSAYDNIPAKMVAFFFEKNKLTHVRLEFPDTSFEKIHAYLSRKFANYPRLDQMPNHHIKPDNYGKPMNVWIVENGLVSMSGEGTPNRDVVVLWSSYDRELLRNLKN